ncbi:MAG: hypothetical protein AAGC78_01905 [Cellvibrio sp.]|uniref:hypothetical protein n=1 Tax=Cellvibrio sp. TaxID=1965322 RepID=UPI0031A895DE
MSAPRIVSAYWQLFRLLTMPARYQFWILIGSLGCVLLGAVGSVLGYAWFWIPAPVLFGIWFFNAALVIHGQLLVLASNRSLNLLPNVRQRALVIHFAIIILISVALTLLQFMKGEALAASVIGSWTLCSLLSFGFIASLVFSPQYGLLLLWLFSWGFYRLIWPLWIPLWCYSCVAVIAWWVYIRWWLRWLPEKRISNPFMVATWETLQQRSQNASGGQGILVGVAQRWLRFFPAKNASPQDAYIYLLMGGAGSRLARLVNWLVALVILMLVFSLCRIFGISNVLQDLAQVAAVICVWGFLGGAGLGFIMWMYHNLGRTWLYFPGSRAALFKAIERRYLQVLLLDALLFCVAGFLVVQLIYPDLYLDRSSLLRGAYYFVLVLSFWWFYFQCAWLVYCRTHGSVQWWNFAVFLYVIGQLMLAGCCWWLVEKNGQSPESLVMILVLGFLLFGLALRPIAQAASLRINFSRRAH